MSHHDPYAPLRPIMARTRTTLNERDFHQAVNVTFHKYESRDYDRLHKAMWQSLPRQFELLVGDLLQSGHPVPDDIHLLDIGCGTGLATDCLLRTALGDRVRSITLLDTSPAMLEQARARSASWRGIPVRAIEGILSQVPADLRFDLIIASSVLHHIPDLAGFFAALGQLQNSGSFFLHVQDPNGDAAADPELAQRRAEVVPQRPPSLFSRILGRIQREITGTQGKNCEALAIRDLAESGVTPLPLTVAELYAITDIHVQNGQGISIRNLQATLSSYNLIRSRSYAFFGLLESELDAARRQLEQQAILRGDHNGEYVGAVWQRI
jgi:SAM-dependent methyltransferase